jgi:YcxB-like protein
VVTGIVSDYAQYKGIRSPITYQWDSERLRAQSATGSGERKWTDYAKVREDDKVLFLYITDYLFEVVPKPWFTDAEKLEEFRRYAAAGREI